MTVASPATLNPNVLTPQGSNDSGFFMMRHPDFANDKPLAHLDYCWLRARQGKARETLNEAQTVLKDVSEAADAQPHAHASALTGLSVLYYVLADDASAFAMARRALELSERFDRGAPLVVRLRTLISLGFVEDRMGAIADAMRCAQSIEHFRPHCKDPYCEVLLHILYAECFWRRGGAIDATKHSRLALNLAIAHQHPALTIAAKYSLAEDLTANATTLIRQRIGGYESIAAQAEVLFGELLQDCPVYEMTYSLGYSELQYSILMLALDRPEEAICHAKACERIADSIESAPLLARCYVSHARALCFSGRLDQAKEVALRALELGRGRQHVTSQLEAVDLLLEIAEKLSDKDLMIDCLKSKIKLLERKSEGEINSLRVLTDTHRKSLHQADTLRQRDREIAELQQSNESLLRSATGLIEASQRDSLTGLANRRYFLEICGEVLQRFQENVFLAFIDVDRFKYINDQFGHAVGDQVLVQVAEILKAETRTDDLAARLSGDEFVLLIPGVGEEAAFAVCTRIVECIRGYAWQRVAVGLKVTISCGISTAANGKSTARDLLSLADQALYRAKERGRNRVIASWMN